MERCFHPPIAVPVGFALAKPDAVNHSVTEKPVRGFTSDWVCAIAEVTAVKFNGYATANFELVCGHLLKYGGVVTSKMERGAGTCVHGDALR